MTSAMRLEIELMESTFFASHELHELYFTEALIGNYALSYALGLVKSPYNRTNVGYIEDFPSLNKNGLYITPAWPTDQSRFKVERFNCQSESYFGAMSNNAVVELSDRCFYKEGFLKGEGNECRVRPTNRPQTGILKMLGTGSRFSAYILFQEEPFVPSYIRLGKFMSKARVRSFPEELSKKITTRQTFGLVNPIDLPKESHILFGDTINIHPTPLVKNADIEGRWWVDKSGKPLLPADMFFGGME
jgi:CRISPR-associated protein Csc1